MNPVQQTQIAKSPDRQQTLAADSSHPRVSTNPRRHLRCGISTPHVASISHGAAPLRHFDEHLLHAEMVGRDGKALREEVGAVLMLHREGRHDEALARAMDLAIKHRTSALALNLSGDLNLKAYFRNRERSAELAQKQIQFAVASYKLAADAAPNCIETVTAHGEAISAFKRHKRAEEEFARAMAIARPADPAMQHAAYGLDGPEHSTKKERIRMAKEKLRRAIDGNCNAICEDDIVQVLCIVKSSGAASAVDSATDVAKRFPLSARAQCLPAHVGLELARSLSPDVDKKEVLRCALDITGDAARTFHRSLVIALFRGKLLAVLREYDAAESECYRALRIEMPDDPKAHDIPLGSIHGEDYDDRVSSVKEQIHGLLKKLVPLAVHHWSFMPSESQNRILSVRVDTLHEHYSKIDQPAAKTISDALRFFKSKNSWSFWICPHPNCDGNMFLSNDLLVEHMRMKHLRGLWEKLQSVLDPKLCENTSKGYCSSDVIALCQDSGQHDIFRFIRMQDIFESLLLRPSSETESQPFVEVRTKICREGTGILEGIKEKLRTLPADMFSNEFVHVRSGIQDLWLQFLNISVFDYREVMLPLARSFQWRELKRCMAQEASIAGRSIDAADIDAIFVDVHGTPDWNVSVDLVLSHSDETLQVDGERQEREVCVEEHQKSSVIVLEPSSSSNRGRTCSRRLRPAGRSSRNPTEE